MPPEPGRSRVPPDPLRSLPPDLAGVLLAVCLTLVAVFAPGLRETPLRVVSGLAFVAFVPGYAFVAALFPGSHAPRGERGAEGGSEAAGGSSRPSGRGIDGVERIALSVGTSVAFVPLVVLALNFTPLGVRLVPIVATVSGVTVALVAVAARRRRALPEAERFGVSGGDWLASAYAEVFEPETRTDAALAVLLGVAVLLAVSSVGYALAVPTPAGSFTEFYVATPGPDGDLVAGDYPRTLTRGEPESLVVGVANHGREPVTYTVLVELQRVRFSAAATTVLESSRVARWRVRLAPEGTWTKRHAVTPRMAGSDLRLVYLLYRGTPPPTPTAANADHALHLWVDVEARSAGNESAVRRVVAPEAPARAATDSG